MYESDLKLCVCGHTYHKGKCNKVFGYVTHNFDDFVTCNCKHFDVAIDLSLENIHVKPFGLS